MTITSFVSLDGSRGPSNDQRGDLLKIKQVDPIEA